MIPKKDVIIDFTDKAHIKIVITASYFGLLYWTMKTILLFISI